MRALVYRNTKTEVPQTSPRLHMIESRGLAYETDMHFVHFYGKDGFAKAISCELAVSERKSGGLRSWVQRVFGATEIHHADLEVGSTIEGVWRPGLFHPQETLQGLKFTDAEVRLAEQALLLLVERLDELLLFIEPVVSPKHDSLQTYSHKTRDLLILACTEVENFWQQYLVLAKAPQPPKGYFTREHYVKLCSPLYLREFQINLPRYAGLKGFQPFATWSSKKGSLPWYDAYNNTKHDRKSHFHDATLGNCLNAVAANIVLFSVRFGPYRLFQGRGTLASLVNPTFTIELPGYAQRSCYAPRVVLPANHPSELRRFDATRYVQNRTVKPLFLS